MYTNLFKYYIYGFNRKQFMRLKVNVNNYYSRENVLILYADYEHDVNLKNTKSKV